MISINEMAELLENAYFCEGFKKVFALDNDDVIAIVDNSDNDISIQICDEESGNTKAELYRLPIELTEPINWVDIAKIINKYLKDNGMQIIHAYDWEDAEDDGSAFKEVFGSFKQDSLASNNFEALYKETIENLDGDIEPERKFEFCLQKLNDTHTGVLDEYKTLCEFGVTGQDAYTKVREANPGWRVYTWGIFGD